MAGTYHNFIDGEWIASQSGREFENRNPADSDDRIGTFPESDRNDVAAAVAAATEAYKEWRLTPAPKRGDILRKAGDILNRQKDDLARAMTREMGKPVFETKGDVQEAIDTAYYSATETRRLFGYNAPSEMPNKMNLSFRMPIGVCGIITAWNFPMAVPSWKIFPALACGNTIVYKPSEDAPHSGNLLAEVLEEAGLPKGVFNVVHGGVECGEAIVDHPDVKVIGFTGSTDVGKAIASKAGAMNKKVSLEMGGKNAQIVMPDADLDLALEGVLWGAFGTTGQRCTATSRLILHEDIHDDFVNKLITKGAALKIGPGLEEGTEMGPVINEKQLDRIAEYVRIGREEDEATCVLGGDRAGEEDAKLGRGNFFLPTIFIGVTRDMRIATEEIFGPVLSVIKVSDLTEAIDILNDTEYGLSSSLYTANVNDAFRAIRDIEAGITYINVPTIGAEAHMPFGGVKGTGNGHREGGWTVFDIFTEWKTVYIDYSGSLQRAQIDNY
ncbi:MAG: aldehyde dehydrogenase family protein [Ignavibacteriae bacterium]|nr:aldehyde dehydrogenase family protein [Ignavibacteriota bacterium]MCB9214307.1 aldehyde dehydrogenase family protein [Ignavibacteria bacterium]